MGELVVSELGWLVGRYCVPDLWPTSAVRASLQWSPWLQQRVVWRSEEVLHIFVDDVVQPLFTTSGASGSALACTCVWCVCMCDVCTCVWVCSEGEWSMHERTLHTHTITDQLLNKHLNHSKVKYLENPTTEPAFLSRGGLAVNYAPDQHIMHIVLSVNCSVCVSRSTQVVRSLWL